MRPDLQAKLDSIGIPYKIYADVVDDATAEQFIHGIQAKGVVQAALMPDCHAGYVVPIGSVYKVEGYIYSSFVGYDIGCGMSECKLDVSVDDITRDQLVAIKNQILRDVPIGFSRHKNLPKKPPMAITGLTKLPMTNFAKEVLQDQGQAQLGTLGGGNHFLELGRCDDGKLSIVIHSGSRGVGHKIATHYMKKAAIANVDELRYKKEFDEKNKDWWNAISGNKQPKEQKLNDYEKAKKEFVYRRVRARVDNIEDAYPIKVHTPLGKDYINDMNMCLEFALANRKAMIDKCIYAVVKVMNGAKYKGIIQPLRFINRNHNHAEHIGSNEWIHRKGATQANKELLGVIPGNMVDGSFIVKGKGSAESLNSSSHGAGRVLSRKKAKESLSLEDFKEATEHLVANHSDGNLDEAPLAYKDIFEVMENQKDLVEVIDRVIPIINIKG